MSPKANGSNIGVWSFPDNRVPEPKLFSSWGRDPSTSSPMQRSSVAINRILKRHALAPLINGQSLAISPRGRPIRLSEERRGQPWKYSNETQSCCFGCCLLTGMLHALAAGHGGGHMGGRFGEPLIGSAPMTSLISNPSTPYTVTQSPEVHVGFPETG